MINKISFQNYKAFNSGQVKIKPITILLGANSVGKSSIMQLFLMLQQTALSGGNYKSALKLHGGFVSLGEGVNLIRRKNPEKTLIIKLDFYNRKILEELKLNYLSSYCQEMSLFSNLIKSIYNKQSKQKDNTNSKSKKSIYNNNEDYDFFMRISSKEEGLMKNRSSFIDLISETNSLISKINLNEIPKNILDDFTYFSHYSGRYSRFSSGRSRGTTDHFKLFGERKEEYILTYDFLKGIQGEIENEHFEIKYEIAVVEKNLVLKNVTIFNSENVLVSIGFEIENLTNSNQFSINSKYIKDEDLKPNTIQSLKQILNNPQTIFSYIKDFNINNTKITSIFAEILGSILVSFNEISSSYFENDNINYVSPIRAHPKRYYFLDKAKINAYVDTLDGDAITETLKENSHLRNQVNNWLRKFNLNVEVKQFQDIIHKLVVNQNSLGLDITDVGFGISQVLPVIIQGFLSHENSLTLIEQPEIHLHPKMQADLADLFIDIVMPTNKNKKNQKASKYLFIETHSEYLLKRLRRRISDGTISADNVAIYLIDPQTNTEGAIIKELEIKEKGQFDWPVDFYGGELLKDTTEFIKNQQTVIN